MQRNQTQPHDDLTTDDRSAHEMAELGPGEDWSMRQADDAAEGQLGPDELPDGNEVVMNLQARRHQ